MLPSQVVLFNLAQDPSEKTNLANKNLQQVAELQQRIEALAPEAVPSLLLVGALGVTKAAVFVVIATPA